MYELKADNPKIAAELEDVIKLFFPDCECAPETIEQTCGTGDKLSVKIRIDGREFSFEKTREQSVGEAAKREYKRFNKLCLYDALSELTGKKLPWGSLTGVRPTKLAYELTADGTDIRDALKALRTLYRVDANKADLLGEILKAQQRIYRETEDELNLYVHIPFCVSRCKYCSFTTEVPTAKYTLVEPYVEALVREIEATKNAVEKSGRSILSVYIGGGTPTALSAEQLKRVLSSANCGNVEYTCEAGRPDTVTEEKLRVMADCGVNRICVNPQTLCDATLVRIGRSHDAKDFFDAFSLARKYPFTVNVDLIAGLEGENLGIFSDTVNGVLGLMPENITVHTLSRKNGSELLRSEYKRNAEVDDMVDFARTRLGENGYIPYYVYRQKRMLGNLENTGYCLNGTQCINNVTTMEECVGVVACGAGAIGKRIFIKEGRIERFANVRDVKLYLEQFDERLDKKLKFIS